MVGEQYNHLLAGYTALLASAANNVALGAVVDQAITTGPTTFFLGDDARVIAHYGGNDAFTDVRINSPSLRDPYLPHLDPLSLTALPANVPPIGLYQDYGWTIPKNENFSIEASRGVVAASPAFVGLWLQFGPKRPMPQGPRFPAFFTTAIVFAAGTWTLGAITFTDVLPAGRYVVAGMAVYGTNLLFSRLVFQGGGYRPGVLCQGAVGEWNGPSMPKDYQGPLGSFLNTVPPQMEMLGTGAGATQTGVMDLIQVA